MHSDAVCSQLSCEAFGSLIFRQNTRSYLIHSCKFLWFFTSLQIFLSVHVLLDHALNHSHKPADGSGSNLTVPKTPNLETRRRLRPNTAISQSGREEAELQEANK